MQYVQEIDKQVRANIKCTQKVMVTYSINLLLNEDKNGADTLWGVLLRLCCLCFSVSRGRNCARLLCSHQVDLSNDNVVHDIIIGHATDVDTQSHKQNKQLAGKNYVICPQTMGTFIHAGRY